MDEEIKEETTQTETETKTKATQDEKKEDVTSQQLDARDNKLWALLSYLGALVVLPLLFKKESAFVQFHAKQGIVILGGWVLGWLPFGFVFAIAAIVFSIVGIISVLKGEKKVLPVIGELAEKINL